MTIEYKRDIRASYMLLKQGETSERYELNMMRHNQIPGLLPFSTYHVDADTVYQYDITGKQALDVKLVSKQANIEFLKALMTGLSSVLEQIENYLLDPDKLLLLPECIFWNNETSELQFCYYPGNTEAMTKMFQKLMEYLLPKIDHKDEEAVAFAYAVYEETLRDGYHLESIRGQAMSVKRVEFEPQEEPTDEVIMQKENIIDPVSSDERDAKKFYRIYKGMIEKKNRFITRFLGKFLKKPQKQERAESFVFEPEPEEVKTGRPTVLLAGVVQGSQGILKYEGLNHLPDLKIDHVPYLIGSDRSCDGILEQNAISRLHARITKTEEVYFIEDLNSTNGTFVGGQQLSYKMRVSIEPNEVIIFANENFRFI